MKLSAAEKLASIRLIRTDNIGPRTYFNLLKKYGSAEEAIIQLPEVVSRSGKKSEICSIEAAEKEISSADKFGIKILHHLDKEYPANLLQTYDAPPVLFYKGNVKLLTEKSIGVVGTRNASANGCAITRRICSALGEAGLIITSGLARGIDAEAHKVALKTGTVAVVAGGLDDVYPPENEKLFHKIAEQGLVISENPLGVKPLARHFPQRNRIIAGLSDGVLVVEAAMKSGSMITAEFALREGREVFAIPGSPLEPRSSGTNQLIKDGATLVVNADDILNNLSPRRINVLPKIEIIEHKPLQHDNLRSEIIAKLSPTPTSIDEIIRQTAATSGEINEILLELEISGKLIRQHGNKVSLAA